VSAHGDFGLRDAYNQAMGLAGVVFALFTSGYILGVWAACLVLKQPQRAYEDGVPPPMTGARTIVIRAAGAERRL
jgi:hypothetical protein